MRRQYDLDALTDIAFGVFAARGFDGASMDDVAAAAGITKAAIYHHVASKEALLAHGLTRALDALEAIPPAARAQTASAFEELRYIVRETARLASVVLPELTVLVRVRGNSATERAAIARRRVYDRTVANVFAAAQAAGEIPPDLDPLLTVRLIFGMCNSIAEWYRPGGRFGPAAIAAAAERLVLSGLK